MSLDGQTVVVTGGAGFVGSSLAVALRRACPTACVVAFDNLRRRGSERTLDRLRQGGVEFLHGDVRQRSDLDDLPAFDLLIDAAAEPSVAAGLQGSPRYVLETNLVGTIHCLELARRHAARVLFLSTSRVYPIGPLEALPVAELDTRFVWDFPQPQPGVSKEGIGEDFPLTGARSYYGTSKLASEILIQEYVHAAGVRALIDRCGVLAGPWQMGKVDQGVVTLWVAAHHFGRPLAYHGYGGHGKQVRDVLHVDDLFELVRTQLDREDVWDGRVYNVGGGAAGSVSLCELTEICRTVTGKTIPIGSVPETHATDVRLFVTDARRASGDFGWRPRHGVAEIVASIHDWIVAEESWLGPLLNPAT